MTESIARLGKQAVGAVADVSTSSQTWLGSFLAPGTKASLGFSAGVRMEWFVHVLELHTSTISMIQRTACFFFFSFFFFSISISSWFTSHRQLRYTDAA